MPCLTRVLEDREGGAAARRLRRTGDQAHGSREVNYLRLPRCLSRGLTPRGLRSPCRWSGCGPGLDVQPGNTAEFPEIHGDQREPVRDRGGGEP